MDCHSSEGTLLPCELQGSGDGTRRPRQGVLTSLCSQAHLPFLSVSSLHLSQGESSREKEAQERERSKPAFSVLALNETTCSWLPGSARS